MSTRAGRSTVGLISACLLVLMFLSSQALAKVVDNDPSLQAAELALAELKSDSHSHLSDQQRQIAQLAAGHFSNYSVTAEQIINARQRDNGEWTIDFDHSEGPPIFTFGITSDGQIIQSIVVSGNDYSTILTKTNEFAAAREAYLGLNPSFAEFSGDTEIGRIVSVAGLDGFLLHTLAPSDAPGGATEKWVPFIDDSPAPDLINGEVYDSITLSDKFREFANTESVAVPDTSSFTLTTILLSLTLGAIGFVGVIALRRRKARSA